jgi:hypothetical protein
LYYNLKDNHYNDDPVVKANFTVPNMGLINDEEYCLRKDSNLTKRERLGFITDYNPDGLPRLIMSELGDDLLPKELNKDMPKNLWN